MVDIEELIRGGVSLRVALAIGLFISLAASFEATRRAIPKLRGANIVGRDIHKEGRPEIPEMGGLGVFIGINVGAFAILALAPVLPETRALIMSGLIVAGGACITGVIDDLIDLRQRFKAFIPFIFAAPLALFASDTTITVPHYGAIPFGLAYTLIVVPTAVACASNGFNMLEGMNGLGTGFGIILATAFSFLAIYRGDSDGLILLLPLLGALAGFLWFNAYPAKIFPGDTMTLTTGAVLGSVAILAKIEFWAAVLMIPYGIEFLLKLVSRFEAESFASRI
ncbi:MAG TPA: hypothetical protein VGB18_04635, partial [Candidatus Thermoplasmatota archaeon]